MSVSVDSILPRDGGAFVSAALVGLAAAGAGAAMLQVVPQLQLEVFARGAAWLVAVVGGTELARHDAGWALTLAGQSVVVSTACSGRDFFLMAAMLIGWRGFGPRGFRPGGVLASLALALPFAVVVNALRIAVVVHAHRWLIPQLPEAYRNFAHLLVGAMVFLPALIALNLALAHHANRPRQSPA